MTTTPTRAQETFAADARSVAQARSFVRRTLRSWDADDLVDTASLIVSELVTNAVVHAGTDSRLLLSLRGRELRIEVEDRHPGRALPMVPEPPPEGIEHGRGLLIATSLATSWGVEYTATSKRVWALCERNGAAPAASGAPPVDLPPASNGARLAVVEVGPTGEITGWSADAEALFGWSAAEATGTMFVDLVDPAGPVQPPDLVPDDGSSRWQGTYAVVRRDDSTLPVFASHVRVRDREGVVALLVPREQRALLEAPVPAPQAAPAAPSLSLGLRDDALVRLGVEEYLALAAERVRDPIAADATYVLLAHDFADELEVVAVSGLPESLLGTRLAPGTPGTPDLHNPRLPVVVPDLRELEVPLLEGTEMRSLLVVPLVMEGKPVGAIAATSVVTDGFSDDEAGLLQRFGDTITVTADRARLKAAEQERRLWLSYIADAGDLLAGSLDQAMTMAITGQVVVPRIARWCAIHLNEELGPPVLQQVWHEDEGRLEALRTAVRGATREQLSDSSVAVPGSWTTTIPLVARGRRIGFITLGRAANEPLRNELFLVAESIARRAALAIDNARAHGELQAAGRALQESLLPPSVPTAPGFDVGVVYEAAGEDAAAGGDFYDLFPTGNGAWCFVVGDVCGTGAEAAAVTGLARHTIQALVRTGMPVAATLERLNTAILDEGPRARFLTLVCGALRVENGQVQLDLVDAGHPLPFLVGRDGRVRELGAPQTLLGVVEHAAYVPERHVLTRGDLLVAVTDGVLERRDGDRMLGEDGLARELARIAHLPAQAIAERIRRLVADFTDLPQRDDIAIMVIRVETGIAAPA